MSIPIVIPWLPATGNTAAVAPVQTLAAAGPLVLNPTDNVSNGPYKFDRVARSVKMTGAANFTITGIGSPVDANGNPTQIYAPISEVVAANGTSVYIYTRIDSIVADAAGAGFSAGFGGFGITDYVNLDYNRTIFQTAISVQFVTAAAGVQVTAYQSLNRLQTPNNFGNLDNFQLVPNAGGPPLTGGVTIPAFGVAGVAAVTANTLVQLPISPVSLVWATIPTAHANTTETIYFTVLQQGIR